MSGPQHAKQHTKDNDQSTHDDHLHIVPPRIYLIVGTTLLILTGATVWAATIELGPWNPVIALFIACVKATIVVLFFMHVKYSSKLTKLTVGAGLFTFLTLIAMT